MPRPLSVPDIHCNCSRHRVHPLRPLRAICTSYLAALLLIQEQTASVVFINTFMQMKLQYGAAGAVQENILTAWLQRQTTTLTFILCVLSCHYPDLLLHPVQRLNVMHITWATLWGFTKLNIICTWITSDDGHEEVSEQHRVLPRVYS